MVLSLLQKTESVFILASAGWSGWFCGVWTFCLKSHVLILGNCWSLTIITLRFALLWCGGSSDFSVCMLSGQLWYLVLLMHSCPSSSVSSFVCAVMQLAIDVHNHIAIKIDRFIELCVVVSRVSCTITVLIFAAFVLYFNRAGFTISWCWGFPMLWVLLWCLRSPVVRSTVSTSGLP